MAYSLLEMTVRVIINSGINLKNNNDEKIETIEGL